MSISVEWRPIPGLVGEYSASSLGDIRSEARTYFKGSRWGFDVEVRHRERLLKPWPCNSGYLTVSVANQRAVNVHRLVALAFHGEPDGRLDVNHKDGNKSNNAAVNLEWCTRSENCFHAVRMGLTAPPKKVIATPKTGGKPLFFDSIRDATLTLGLPLRNGNVRSAVLGQIPSAYGYRWRYAD